METAKVFWSGRSQAVRLPKACRFESDEARIRRHGDAVILEPVARDWAWLDLLIRPLDADFAAAAAEEVADQERPELDFGIPAVAAHELFYSAYRSANQAQNLAVLEFDKEDARQAREVRAMLAAAGTPIGPYDVLIAGQALARGLVLVTHNVGEFARVADLQVEDWHR